MAGKTMYHPQDRTPHSCTERKSGAHKPRGLSSRRRDSGRSEFSSVRKRCLPACHQPEQENRHVVAFVLVKMQKWPDDEVWGCEAGWDEKPLGSQSDAPHSPEASDVRKAHTHGFGTQVEEKKRGPGGLQRGGKNGGRAGPHQTSCRDLALYVPAASAPHDKTVPSLTRAYKSAACWRGKMWAARLECAWFLIYREQRVSFCPPIVALFSGRAAEKTR